MRFTDRALKALKPESKRYEIAETNGRGFRIRVFPTGNKSFVWRYKHRGKSRLMVLGQYPDEITLAKAHAKHGEFARQLKEEGTDPGAVKQEQIAADRAAETVNELAEQYISRHAKRFKKSWREDERVLGKDVLPLWGELKAKDIRRKDVIALLDGIVDRGAGLMANRTLEIVRRMFNFAVERDILEHTPCHLIKAPAKEVRRDRVLSPEEIKQFWRRLPRTRITRPVQLALKFGLVTAQRRGEVTNARWSDFDLEAGWWTIPETKNKLSHRVPLSPMALALLHHIRRYSGDSEFLFPHRSQDAPMDDRTTTGAVARNFKTLGIEKFTVHDLRRTAASQMASAGVSRLVIGKVLNHAEPGITAVYDRHSYDAEKQRGLTVWGETLFGVIRGDRNRNQNVIQLAGKR